MLALVYASSYPERIGRILLTVAIGAHAGGLKRFSEELEKRVTK